MRMSECLHDTLNDASMYFTCQYLLLLPINASIASLESYITTTTTESDEFGESGTDAKLDDATLTPMEEESAYEEGENDGRSWTEMCSDGGE